MAAHRDKNFRSKKADHKIQGLPAPLDKELDGFIRQEARSFNESKV